MFLIFPVVTYVAQCAAIYWTVVSHIIYHFTVTVTINTAQFYVHLMKCQITTPVLHQMFVQFFVILSFNFR